MGLQKTSVGLDLGARNIRAVQVRLSGTEAKAERSLSLSREELQAEGVDPDDLDELVPVLRDKMVEAGIRPRDIVLGIDSKESMLRYVHMPPMPVRRLETVMKYEVESVAERMEEPVAADFGVLPVMRETDDEQNILLGLAKEAPLEEVLAAFEDAGLPIRHLAPPPLAVYSAWDLFATKADPDAPEDDMVLVVDLGATSLHIAMVLNDRLAFARSATFGGDNFTDALVKALSIDRAKAEKVKCARGGLDDALSGVLLETVGPMRTAAGQLLGMLQSSMRLAANQVGLRLPPITRLWFTGGGMRLRGLGEYLARGLGGKPFEVFDPQVATEAEDAGGVPANLGLAVGLSAMGLAIGDKTDGAVRLNILPQKYQERRRFWERTIFLYAAASFLVALLAAQLVHGLVKNSGASRMLTTLQAQMAALEDAQSKMDDHIDRSRRSRAVINRLLVEAEPTAFQAFVLDLLGRELRPEIQIERLGLVPIEVESKSKDKENRFGYLMTIDGRVNNDRRLGLEWILELQDLLQREERIRDVKVTSTRERGAWIDFSLEVFPNYVST